MWDCLVASVATPCSPGQSQGRGVCPCGGAGVSLSLTPRTGQGFLCVSIVCSHLGGRGGPLGPVGCAGAQGPWPPGAQWPGRTVLAGESV